MGHSGLDLEFKSLQGTPSICSRAITLTIHQYFYFIFPPQAAGQRNPSVSTASRNISHTLYVLGDALRHSCLIVTNSYTTLKHDRNTVTTALYAFYYHRHHRRRCHAEQECTFQYFLFNSQLRGHPYSVFVNYGALAQLCVPPLVVGQLINVELPPS